MKLARNYSVPGSSETTLRTLFVIAATVWAGAVLVFVLPTLAPFGEASMATVAYGCAAVFALAAASAAALRSGSEVARTFWALLFGGLLFKLLGDLGWGGTRLFGMAPSALVFHDVAHVLSYAVILAALLWLVARTTRSITLVAALDAASIMLSVGVLAWYFVLGPSAAIAGGLESPREVLMTLSGSVFDAGFLFLSLLVLSTTYRPVFIGYLAAAFGAFLVADGAHLTLRSAGPYEMGNVPELAWALGMVFLGVGTLKTLSSCSFARELEISPWRVASFWFGPLSPAIHLALLLTWGALYPPLPSPPTCSWQARCSWCTWRSGSHCSPTSAAACAWRPSTRPCAASRAASPRSCTTPSSRASTASRSCSAPTRRPGSGRSRTPGRRSTRRWRPPGRPTARSAGP